MITTGKMILQEKFCEITYDEANKILVAKWIGFLKLEDVKKGCNVISDFAKKNQLSKHLSDQTQLKVLSKEVQEYLVSEFFPVIGNHGVKKVAVLVSDDIFAKATVDNVNSSTATKVGKITFKTFNAKSDCINWLNE